MTGRMGESLLSFQQMRPAHAISNGFLANGNASVSIASGFFKLNANLTKKFFNRDNEANHKVSDPRPPQAF